MKKDNVIKIFFVLLIIIVIIVVANYVTKLNTNKLETHSFYQYFAGRKVEYKGNLELSKKTNGITNLQIEEVTIGLDSTPIYYQDTENKMLFPQDMAVIFPQNQGLMQRVTHFSTLELQENIPYLQYEKNKKVLQNAFLFDGKDLYVFLEPTTINIEDEIYELTPLSYAIVTYRQTVEIYQKQEDIYQTIECKTGNVTAKTDKYEINLSTDAFTYQEKEQLLLKKIELLPGIEW